MTLRIAYPLPRRLDWRGAMRALVEARLVLPAALAQGELGQQEDRDDHLPVIGEGEIVGTPRRCA